MVAQVEVVTASGMSKRAEEEKGGGAAPPKATSAMTTSSEASASPTSTRKDTNYFHRLVPRDRQTYISRLILQMEECLTELEGRDIDYSILEQKAILIHESMSSSSRNYHSVQHVFDISKDLRDPICILAAFFHDCIYYHVDGGLSEVQERILEGVFEVDDSSSEDDVKGHTTSQKSKDMSKLILSKRTTQEKDPLIYLVEMIFGFEPGQLVTAMTGLNEFLSAVIAVRELNAHLPLKQLAQIACCIEATIPFRPSCKTTGRTAMDRLYENLKSANEELSLGMSDKELVESVQRACILSNSDVGNFGTSDRLWFLDNTWSLLPETNESLRHQYLYTVKQFQHAVFKMNGFFGFLRPDVVFQSFRGVPSEQKMDDLLKECISNLEIGKKYVGAKLLALSVLAAFAELTGGDAPMSLFMGDLPNRHHNSAKLEDSLPSAPEEILSKCDPVVYDILSRGRRTETTFDIRQSPLAAYLYGWLGDDRLMEVLKDVKQYPMERENSIQLLSSLPRDAIRTIAINMAKVALSRSDLILDVVESLPGNE